MCDQDLQAYTNYLADIGIEGGNLSKQGGLIREASDMQRIADTSKKSGGGGGGKPEGDPAPEEGKK